MTTYAEQEQRSAETIDAMAPFLLRREKTLSLKETVGICELERRASYAHTDDDAVARNLLIQRCAEVAAANPTPETICALAYAQTMEGILYLLWRARWANQGFPVVRVSQRLAASFMATGFHESVISDIIVPWRAFAIVPLLPIHFIGSDGKPEAVREVMVLSTTAVEFGEYPDNPFTWFVGALGERGTMLHRTRAAHALFKHSDTPAPVRHVLNHELQDGDERAGDMLVRLVGGVCLEMSDPNTLEKAKRGKAHSRSSRSGEPPEPRVYELTRAVTMDVREEVLAYVEGRRGTRPSVQVLVAGHWKRQRCGAGGLERKLIQIEPYWRGPELAPILGKAKS